MKQMLLAGGLLGCCFAMAQPQIPQPAQAAAQSGAAASQAHNKATPSAAAADVGEKKFQQNCNRCHNAPQELSPRITGTVILHMRVRASLSEADAQAILHYLAP